MRIQLQWGHVRVSAQEDPVDLITGVLLPTFEHLARIIMLLCHLIEARCGLWQKVIRWSPVQVLLDEVLGGSIIRWVLSIDSTLYGISHLLYFNLDSRFKVFQLAGSIPDLAKCLDFVDQRWLLGDTSLLLIETLLLIGVFKLRAVRTLVLWHHKLDWRKLPRLEQVVARLVPDFDVLIL